jgi:hypothetical protein
MFASQLFSLMLGGRVIPVLESAPQFPVVPRNLRLIATDVALPPVAIFGKHCSRTQSDQQ